MPSFLPHPFFLTEKRTKKKEELETHHLSPSYRPPPTSTPVSDQGTEGLGNLHNSDNAHGYAKAFYLDDENG
jgi:hypothetical protein